MPSPQVGVSPGLAEDFPSLPVVRPPFDHVWLCTIWLYGEETIYIERAEKRLRPWFVRDVAEARRALQTLRDAGVDIVIDPPDNTSDPSADQVRH